MGIKNIIVLAIIFSVLIVAITIKIIIKKNNKKIFEQKKQKLLDLIGKSPEKELADWLQISGITKDITYMYVNEVGGFVYNDDKVCYILTYKITPKSKPLLGIVSSDGTISTMKKWNANSQILDAWNLLHLLGVKNNKNPIL